MILFVIFQSIFSLAEYPMGLIEQGFAWLSGWLVTVLPSGVLTDLLVDGIVAGLGGVVIFVPQIVILFAFIAILEDTGYMARVIFLMDRSEEHTSELQSLMRISYAVFCLKKKNK